MFAQRGQGTFPPAHDRVAARHRILADEGVLNMPMAVYVTVLAIVFGFAVPASADDRPSDPFGNHTIELNKEAPQVKIWEYLINKPPVLRSHLQAAA